MKATTKRRLKIYLPIILAAVLIVAAIIAIILLSNRITAKDYFDALRHSNYTKQVQHTTIMDGELLVYEKVETIIFEGENAYHKIEEKQISSDLNKDYDESTSEFYYSKDKMYYFDEGVWKQETFTISNKLKSYYLQTDYFSSLEFNKKVETEGFLKGNLKNASIKKVVNSEDITNVSLEIVVNKNFDVQQFVITGKTLSMRDVLIQNVYTYNTETVTLPV